MKARTVMILGLSLGVSAEGCTYLLGGDQEYSPAVHDNASNQGGASGSATSGDESSNSGPGAPTCPAALDACGTECVNTSSNPHHCGACGHDCEGQPCAGGLCAPVKLSLEPEGVYFIALHKGFVYFTNARAGTVRRVSVSGGDSVAIADQQNWPTGIAVDDHFVYWSVAGAWSDKGAVRKAPLDGGAATTIAKELLAPYDLVVTPQNTIWMNWDYEENPEHYQRTLMRSGLDMGGSASTLAESGDKHWTIGRADSDVFAMRFDGAMMRIPADGGDPVSITTTASDVRSIAVGRDALYFSDWGSVIQKISLDGGDPVVFYDGAVDGVSSILSMTVDDTYLYLCEDKSGIIRRVPIAGGPATLLAIGQSQPQHLVVDDKYAYWVNWSGGVMKTPK